MEVNCEKMIVLTDSSSTSVLRISRTRRILEDEVRPFSALFSWIVLRFVSHGSQRSRPLGILH
jgi:hypothetical protein